MIVYRAHLEIISFEIIMNQESYSTWPWLAIRVGQGDSSTPIRAGINCNASSTVVRADLFELQPKYLPSHQEQMSILSIENTSRKPMNIHESAFRSGSTGSDRNS